jgi:hypothetical protein
MSYPEQRADLERRFRMLRSQPADIWFTAHARRWARYRKFVARDAATNPVDAFIDPEGYRARSRPRRLPVPALQLSRHLVLGSWEVDMPEKATLEESRKAKRTGRSPTTQAGAFVREEIHHVREGKHGARSTKQAIAIGLSKARRAGVHLPPPPDTATPRTKQSAASSTRAAKRRARPSPRRSRAARRALKHAGGRNVASKQALSAQAKGAARRRSAASRKASARKAVRTKGPQLRHEAAQRAARTRKARRRRTAH